MAYKFHSLCVPVNGFLRTAVYDLQTGGYEFAMRELVRETTLRLPSPEVLSPLLAQRLIFQNNGNVKFGPLNDEPFDFPSLVSNAIVEINKDTEFRKVIDFFESVNCRSIQFILPVRDELLSSNMEDLINCIYKSSIQHCEIVMSNRLFQETEAMLDTEHFPELNLVMVYGTDRREFVPPTHTRNGILYIGNEVTHGANQHKKNPEFFVVNSSFYVEALNHNVYYNRKLYLDVDGTVRNGPLSPIILGNLYLDGFDFTAVMARPEFMELWNIKKDDISVCSQCEFRYMCMDARIPEAHSDAFSLPGEKRDRRAHWYHPTECNYNPYIARWEGDPDYRTLRECGVEVGENGLEIDYDQLERVIVEIYNL